VLAYKGCRRLGEVKRLLSVAEPLVALQEGQGALFRYVIAAWSLVRPQAYDPLLRRSTAATAIMTTMTAATAA